MIDDLEVRVRAAVPAVVGSVDVSSLRARARSRRRRRRILSVAGATVLAVGAFALVVALRDLDNEDAPATHVNVPALPGPISWTRSPGIPGSLIVDIASSSAGAVAVGSSNNAAMIWYSPDGHTWQVSYSEAVSEPDEELRVARTTFRSVFATTHGFVALGDQTRTDGQGAIIASVMTSVDGRSWQPADDSAFLPVSDARPKGVGSMVYGVTDDHGRLVAVGDIFTDNQHQRAGLSPCVWTSHDGVLWTREIVDLGSGFDPYFTGITVRNGRFVASGRTGKFPAVAWTSRDLVHWQHDAITPQGGAAIVHTRHGYIAFGAISIRSRKNPALQPALWQSDDGREWHRVLRLRSGVASAGFSSVLATGDTLIAVAQYQERQAARGILTNMLYASVDGEHWVRIDPDHAAFPGDSTLSGYGTIGNTVVIAGSDASGSAFWTAAGSFSRR